MKAYQQNYPKINDFNLPKRASHYNNHQVNSLNFNNELQTLKHFSKNKKQTLTWHENLWNTLHSATFEFESEGIKCVVWSLKGYYQKVWWHILTYACTLNVRGSDTYVINVYCKAWIPWILSFHYILFLEKRLQAMLWHHHTGVNSLQRWKQTRFHLWCELTSTMKNFMEFMQGVFFFWGRWWNSQKQCTIVFFQQLWHSKHIFLTIFKLIHRILVMKPKIILS